VLIVRTEGAGEFAVVGSGNLSEGGFITNTECAVFVNDAAYLRNLTEWFDMQFDAGTPLILKMIDTYEPAYTKAKAKRAALEKLQNATHSKLKSVGQASLANWNGVLAKAEKYFRSPSFNKSYSEREKAAKRILELLRAPDFDFDRDGWNEFFSVRPLGRLDERYRDKLFSQQRKLRQALKALLEQPEKAIPMVLGRGGRLRVKGFGQNTVSKILAAHAPNDWPVYNSPVADALESFGYLPPKGADAASRYLAYRNTMKRFMAALKQRGCRTVDAWSLDAFFYKKSKELEAGLSKVSTKNL
jgi:hypothetical protein